MILDDDDKEFLRHSAVFAGIYLLAMFVLGVFIVLLALVIDWLRQAMA